MASTDTESKTKYAREIIVSRILSAIIWSIFLQCVYVSCVLVLMNIDILHPLQWIKNAYTSIFNLGTWFYLIPLGVIVFAQGVVMSKDFMSDPQCARTRFGIFCSALQPRNFILALLNLVFGAMIVSYYSALLGDETNIFSRKCRKETGKCLNERNLLLIACGMWVGLYSSVKRQIWEVRVVIFPITQQLKYPQVKSALGQLMMQSFKEAVFPYLYFCFLYGWFGSYLREHLSGFLGLPVDEDSLMSVLFWMNPFLAMRCILFSAIVILTGRTLDMLFWVFLTERCSFPITDSLGDKLILNDALASPLPLMKRLGYLDLLHIAERDPIRQRELFSLSLPGGHPHNWNRVVNEVLRTLETFTSDMNVVVCEMNRAANGPLLPTTPKVSRTVEIQSPTTATVTTSSPTSPSLRLRNMSIIQTHDLSTNIGAKSPLLYSSDSRVHHKREVDVVSASKIQLLNILQWVRCKPGIRLLFGEMDDAQARHLLLLSQHLSWGAQALAHLSAVSLKRDVYGVVQKDLPSIITTLVQLKSVLERLPLHSHKKSLRQGSLDSRLKAALTSAVKRSLYILCEAFGPYLTELPLSADLLVVLGNYVSYNEG